MSGKLNHLAITTDHYAHHRHVLPRGVRHEGVGRYLARDVGDLGAATAMSA